MFYQGASSDLLRAAVDAGAKGIVIAVAGADLTGGSLAPGIAYAERQGVIVVAATRTGSGRIAALASNRLRDGMVGGEDLTPLKARILLMVALTKTQSATEIQRMFTGILTALPAVADVDDIAILDNVVFALQMRASRSP